MVRKHHPRLAGPGALLMLLFAAPAQADPIPVATARAVVKQTIELVEAEGLYPRKQEQYAAAKASLLAILGSAEEDIDRAWLFLYVTGLLQTLDADGHSFILSPARQPVRPPTTPAPTPASSFAVLTTPHGKVLHWTPPQSVMSSTDGLIPARYLARFSADHTATPDAGAACALVVDLSAQLGGNAWPPFVAMHPLFSQGNRAAWVKRDGERIAFVEPAKLQKMAAGSGGAGENPLQRFAGEPFAVVVDRKTSSAGEMLLVALMAEGARARTFGYTSHGLTTANNTHQLADGSMLALTTMRYAIGDAPVIRGGIAPQVPAAAGMTAADIVRQAADWAARSSPLCRD